MRTPDTDLLAFFDGHRKALPVYEALEEALYGVCPSLTFRVQKTQITFCNPRVFACVSFTRVRRAKELPPAWLTLTLGLPAPPDSPRVDGRCEIRPGRWTVHLALCDPAEVDDELVAWIGESHRLARSTLRRR